MTQAFSDYELGEEIGRGAHGVVYRAFDRILKRSVALKILRADQVPFEAARARFFKEIAAAARLSHPGIATVYAFGEEQGRPWFTLELIEGRSLDHILEQARACQPSARDGGDFGASFRGPGSAFQGTWSDSCLRVAIAIADALAHAHERGVLHRDVKPSNIIVTEDGRVVLVDFGLASLVDSNAITAPMDLAGSLPYASPEQVDGRMEDLAATTDVYSLAVTLYEMLTLCSPFEGSTVEALQGRILDGDFVPLRVRRRELAFDLAIVCQHAMALAPADRYSHAALFADDLRRVLARRPILVRPPGPARRLLRWAQRKPAKAATVGIAIFAFLVAPVAFGLQRYALATELEKTGERLQGSLEERRVHLAGVLDALSFASERFSSAEFEQVPRLIEARREVAERALRILAEMEAIHPHDAQLEAQKIRFQALRR